MKFQIILLLILLGTVLTTETNNQKPQINYKFVFFPEECFNKFFFNFDFLDVQCLVQTASKGLSVAIVALSLTLKLPQIIKISRNSSVEGLSFQALFFESIMYLFNVAYNIHKKNNFMLYGENIFIIAQNMIIFYLFLKFDNKTSKSKIFTHFILYSALSSLLLMGFVPEIIFTFSIYLNMTLIFISRIPQIKLNFKNKSTGQLALITYLLSFAGAITRAFTIFVTSYDLLYNLQNLEGASLSGIIVFQILYYRKAKKE